MGFVSTSGMRHARAAFAGLALAVAALLPATAQQNMPSLTGTVPFEDLIKAGTIPENVLGDPKAPVTVIEYASLTCPHCAAFHKDSYPVLKKDFIDTGKVRFIFRDFPFDGLALAGTLLSRCAGEGKFFSMTELLFSKQDDWAFAKDPESAIKGLWKDAGFSQEAFDSCMQNQTIYDGVLAVRQRAYETFGVDSTPTIFVNGNRYRGALSPQQLEAAIKAALEGK